MLRVTAASALVSVLVFDGHLSTGIAWGQVEDPLPAGDPPPIEWEMRFSGQGKATGFATRETQDGGFAVAGLTWSAGDPIPPQQDIPPTDAYLLKTDRAGNLLWEKTFGGKRYDAFRRLEEARDGGFILIGWTESTRGDGDLYLVKTDAGGNLAWERAFGGSLNELGFSLLETSDGDYVAVGQTESLSAGGSLYFIRVSPSGETVFEKAYETGCERGVGVGETDGGGFFLASSSSCGPLGDVHVIRTDASGEVLWKKTPVTSEGFATTAAFDMALTADGGGVLSGYVLSIEAFAFHAWLLKLDDIGEVVWNRGFGAEDPAENTLALSVQPTADGGFITCGRPWIAKVDASGSRTWQITRENADLFSVRQTGDGGFIVAGEVGERFQPPQPGSDCLPFLAGGCVNGDAYLFKVAGPTGPAARFRRGDANADAKLNITDAVFTFQHLFHGGPPPLCPDSADSDDNGALNLTDGIDALNYLFRRGAVLPAPGPILCGADETEDPLEDCSYETTGDC